MARKPLAHCKAAGCTNERYVWVNTGARSTYCKEHLYLRSTKQRGDYPAMTNGMREILRALRDALEAGCGALVVNRHYYNGRTLRIMQQRDWLFISTAHGETISITTRGLEALAAYEPVQQRRDGICPNCGVNPRKFYTTGRYAPYCETCDRALTRERSARLRRLPGYTERPCCKCHSAPRRRYPGGGASSCCVKCDNERTAKRNQRNRARELEEARAGVVRMCVRCGANPRHVFPNSVARYCAACLPVVNKRYKKLAKFNRIMGKSKGVWG